MRKKISSVLCAILILLLAACSGPEVFSSSSVASVPDSSSRSAPPASSSASVSAALSSSASTSEPNLLEVKDSYVPEPESIPVPPADAPEWKRLVYETVTQNLSARGHEIISIELHKSDAGNYTLVAEYGKPSFTFVNVWLLAKNQAVLHLSHHVTDSRDFSFEGILESSGLPVVSLYYASYRAEDPGYHISYQYENGIPTERYRRDTNGLYHLPDGSSYFTTFPAASDKNGLKLSSVVQSLELRRSFYQLSDKMVCQKLYDYLFGAAYLQTPPDSPEWLTQYLSAFASKSMLPYNEDNSQATAFPLRPPSEISIYEPLMPGGAPLIGYVDPSLENHHSSYLCPTAEGLWEFRPIADVCWRYAKDSNGKAALQYRAGFFLEVYDFTPSRKTYLFSADMSNFLLSTEYAYCGTEYQTFTEKKPKLAGV